MAGRILIVDNVPTNRIILKVKLSSAYYDVIQATCGKDALDRARDSDPEIIILDTDLGDMTAHDACAHLKADPATRHIPVLIATPPGDTEAKIAALKAGADEFLAKPIDELALTARVRALMRARATTDELRRRDETARSLGFAEAPSSFAALGKIVLIGRSAEDAMTWRAGLRGLVMDEIEIIQADKVLEAIAKNNVADLYVISSDILGKTNGLRLLSDIRARPHTRSAGIVVVHGPQDRKEAVMALDLGANDIITRGADPEELALRLRSQMRRKKEADVLRNSVDEGLRLAMIDPLTGLYNRRYALPYIAQVSQKSILLEQNFALMLIDLDRFKLVNDTYGHAVGDQVLTEVAKRMRDNLRGIDLVARFGGEEFLICMPMTTLVEARTAAERLRSVIFNTPVAVASDGTSVSISASIGLSMGGQTGETIEMLLQISDRALYDAKAEGRNQVTLGSHAA
ncbi:diguanylate cyclase [Pacificibacter marinus]|uniref:diguanylate cyclase n=1 Tax=Pacificibacter marinus TaxID=658057 RepID=A0A1Y5SM13_9RHOB|nr:diguanylate cyclase [Pacificibacter marinus]SEK60097.1 response regulator receiver modulated diguanylate cyclase [Pacificibacter marinus]SLN42136.1 Response regulator PleD [Pacificibacter marinus]